MRLKLLLVAAGLSMFAFAPGAANASTASTICSGGVCAKACGSSYLVPMNLYAPHDRQVIEIRTEIVCHSRARSLVRRDFSERPALRANEFQHFIATDAGEVARPPVLVLR